MRSLKLEPLSEKSFAPFGDVIAAPERPGDRAFYEETLGSSRAEARLGFHANHVPPSSLPYVVDRLERHPYSSQTFIPLDVSRFVVVVAPDGDNGPDDSQVSAFLAPGTVGVTYRPGVWHHGIVGLDRPASFTVLMWRIAPGADDEFVELEEAIELRL